jgi:hypothetical protein
MKPLFAIWQAAGGQSVPPSRPRHRRSGSRRPVNGPIGPGIGLMTPDQVHYGQTDTVHAARQDTLDHAFRENPERFVNEPPTPPNQPTAAWINPALATPKIQA